MNDVFLGRYQGVAIYGSQSFDDGREVPEGAMRVGPNTDAVVWKLCDTNETVEL